MATPTIPYLRSPADVVNESLDQLGVPGKIIGDINDGTAVAEAARRNYGTLLRQLLRTAHWTWARKQATLQILGDSTGQSPSYVSTFVEQPWTYAYAWPTDAVAGRWMPVQTPLATNGALTDANGTPLTTAGASSSVPPVPLLPARFLVSSSDQYPVEIGQTAWASMPDLQRTEGVGPISRRIILTDCQNALFVYTRLVTVVEEWDHLFRQAFVASLAVALTPTCFPDDHKTQAMKIAQMVPIAKMAIADARVANGNDAGFPQSVDTMPAWITARSGGWYGYGSAGGSSYGTLGLYLPWEPFSLGGSVW